MGTFRLSASSFKNRQLRPFTATMNLAMLGHLNLSMLIVYETAAESAVEDCSLGFKLFSFPFGIVGFSGFHHFESFF
jgi:hypothetical protein